MKNKIPLFFLATALLAGYACRPASAPTEMKQALYHCPMHPSYTSDRPGECPICHMALVPVEPALPMDRKADEGGDRAPVYVAGEKEQWIGVRTAVVEKKELEVLVRASARVSYDPDLFALLAEHREFLAARDRAASGGNAEAAARAEGLLRSSRIRLAQSGLSDAQMDKMARGGGQGLLAGSGPREVYVQVYEDEAGLVKPGQSVDFTSPALSNQEVMGRVESLDRVVDPATRTIRARVRVTAGAEELRPEMYLEAVIHVGLGKRLALPKEALIDTGTRRLVYVKTEPGHYVPKTVTVGREAEEDFEVLSGLSEGDEVVASGQFLIDSESRLKAVVSGADHVH
ncbi:MAG: efflux RND transporter periplasmic adaptor subunit [Elusimicrobia bacterium]|nr:efflux RND transporter periplasmic adaptor subunit [Elusimicrobiota bacterium]